MLVGLVLPRAEHGDASLRLVWTAGPTGGIPSALALLSEIPDWIEPARERGATAVSLLGVRASAPWLLPGVKSTSYAVNMAAIREAKRRGADDAVFVSSDGFVLEAPTASLILRVGGRFVTPAPNGGILHGTTQLSLFAHLEEQGARTAYETIPVSALAEADAAWLVSSVRLAAPIRAIDGRELSLSNLDKVLYPGAGFRKADVIDYYRAIAPTMLEHMKGRPPTLVRAPDGVGGEQFFEKRCPPHHPAWVDTQANVAAGNAKACVIDEMAALIWLANLAALVQR